MEVVKKIKQGGPSKHDLLVFKVSKFFRTSEYLEFSTFNYKSNEGLLL